MMVIPNRVRLVASVMVYAVALAAGLVTLALLENPAQAHAETITDSDQSTFNWAFVTCTGEEIWVEGTMHLVTHTTTDAKGGLHTKIHLNMQGEGESDSGAKYVFKLVDNAHENFPGGAHSYNATVLGTSNLIRQGSATPTDDFKINILTHVTLNAQGEITSVVTKNEELEGECK